MKNTGKPYEDLVERMFQELLKQGAVKTIELKRNVRIEGASTTHEIDIYWSFEIGGITYVTIVQAKDEQCSISQGKVLQFKAILDDISRQPRGIFVSRHGFQSGAINVAKQHGIVLYEFREPTDKDWDGAIRRISIDMVGFMPDYKLKTFLFDENWIREKLQGTQIPKGTQIQFKWDGLDIEMLLYDTQFKPFTNLNEFIFSTIVPKKMEALGPVQTIYKFQVPVYSKIQNPYLEFVKLQAIDLTYTISKHSHTINIDASDFVGFILTNVIENTTVRFNKDMSVISNIDNNELPTI